jgi:hypothetical protein
MNTCVRFLAALCAAAAVCAWAAAEVPPLPEKELVAQSDVIVVGTVDAVKATVKKKATAKERGEEEYLLTVTIKSVDKGKLNEGTKTLTARGWYYELPPGFAGAAGHYSANTDDRVAGVEKGWELKLYLKAGADGVYDIVSPNGFAVQKKLEKKDK